jgi:endonuclease YncB( thermonuclease family)
MPVPRPFVALLMALAIAGGAHAETITGTVVSIADGDTLTLLDATRTQHKIRLAGIDAPEKAQPYGNVSRQSLGELAFQRWAVADCPKKDRYGRRVCTVTVNGQDVGLLQLRRGGIGDTPMSSRRASGRPMRRPRLGLAPALWGCGRIRTRFRRGSGGAVSECTTS